MRIALFLLWLARCKFQVSEKRKNGRFVTSGTECRTLRLEPGPGRAIDQVSENLKFLRFRGECSAQLWVDVEILPKSWPARGGCKNNTTHSVFTCPENWHCMFWVANDLPPNKISCILCGKVFKNKFKEDSHMKKCRFVLEYRSQYWGTWVLKEMTRCQSWGTRALKGTTWQRWLPSVHSPPVLPRVIAPRAAVGRLQTSPSFSLSPGASWEFIRVNRSLWMLIEKKGKRINLIFSNKAWIISQEQFSCQTYMWFRFRLVSK